MAKPDPAVPPRSTTEIMLPPVGSGTRPPKAAPAGLTPTTFAAAAIKSRPQILCKGTPAVP